MVCFFRLWSTSVNRVLLHWGLSDRRSNRDIERKTFHSAHLSHARGATQSRSLAVVRTRVGSYMPRVLTTHRPLRAMQWNRVHHRPVPLSRMWSTRRFGKAVQSAPGTNLSHVMVSNADSRNSTPCTRMVELIRSLRIPHVGGEIS